LAADSIVALPKDVELVLADVPAQPMSYARSVTRGNGHIGILMRPLYMAILDMIETSH